MNNPILDPLVTILNDARSSTFTSEVLSELLTPLEQKTISNRIKILELLQQQLPYEAISSQLGVSAATIAALAPLAKKPVAFKMTELLQKDARIKKLVRQLWPW